MARARASLDLAALVQAGDDLRDEQLLGIGVDAGVERDARGGDALADVRATVNVHAAVDLEALRPGRQRRDRDEPCPRAHRDSR